MIILAISLLSIGAALCIVAAALWTSNDRSTPVPSDRLTRATLERWTAEDRRAYDDLITRSRLSRAAN